jgi:chromosome segregation ATPase
MQFFDDGIGQTLKQNKEHTNELKHTIDMLHHDIAELKEQIRILKDAESLATAANLRYETDLIELKQDLAAAHTQNEEQELKNENRLQLIEIQHRETMSKCSDLELEKAEMQRTLHELQQESENMRNEIALKSANRKSMAQSRIGLDTADLEYLTALEEEIDIITTERDQLQIRLTTLEAAASRLSIKPSVQKTRDSFATTNSSIDGKEVGDAVIEAAATGDIESLRIITIQNRNLREDIASREVQLEQLLLVIEGFEIREKEFELTNKTLSSQVESLQSDARENDTKLNEAREEFHVISKQYEDYKGVMKETCQEYETALANEQKSREGLETELNALRSQGKLTVLSGYKTTRNPPPPPVGINTSESAPVTPAKLTLAEMRKARDLRKAK